MADSKRYYWLKLQNDFFDSLRIKKLRKLAGGDTFTIIYLKMQLKSLKTNGILQYKGIEGSFEEEMALELDEEVENVKLTIAYLKSCGLLEISESDSDVYKLPYVNSNTGSETAVAQRVRDYRSRQEVLHCNTDVTEVKQLCNVEIDIEKDIDKEIKKDKKKNKQPAVENTVFFPEDEELNQAFLDFVKMRKSIKKPLATDRAVTLALNKLETLSNGDRNIKLQLINDAVMNSWQSFYLRKENTSTSGAGRGKSVFDIIANA